MDSLLSQPVARRISSVRWLPPRAGSAYTDSELYFASGSQAKHKELILWTTENPDFAAADDSPPDGRSLATPVARVAHDGGVEQIVAPAPDVVVTASSHGALGVYSVAASGADSGLALRGAAAAAHRFGNGEPAAATGLAAQPGAGADGEVASSGEDGRLVCARVARLDALERHEVDSTAVTGVCWPTAAQVAVSTRAGQVKLFDRRALGDVAAVFVDPSHACALECIAAHPSQPFRLATGTDAGGVLLWDIRSPRQPTAEAFNVHDANVWAVQFHPADPSHIVSCSEDASVAVVQWLPAPDAAQPRPVRRLASFFNALAVTCLDVCPYTRAGLLVAGSDSGNLLMDRAGLT
ncbi:hypothetical protein H4R18_001693 [Coemansia javaensis]|uniref:Uncharacterized protein n=1 Tax=Coemansia javaensis TaxID=2761396 RepID=A0A9W8HIV6_9FUNG|nr:hypothetical protein H4R18_001693 [Coemansia javaensis]